MSELDRRNPLAPSAFSYIPTTPPPWLAVPLPSSRLLGRSLKSSRCCVGFPAALVACACSDLGSSLVAIYVISPTSPPPPLGWSTLRRSFKCCHRSSISSFTLPSAADPHFAILFCALILCQRVRTAYATATSACWSVVLCPSPCVQSQ